MQRSSIYSSSIPSDFNTLESIFGHSDSDDADGEDDEIGTLHSERRVSGDAPRRGEGSATQQSQSSHKRPSNDVDPRTLDEESAGQLKRQPLLNPPKPPQVHTPITVSYDHDKIDSSTVMTEFRIISIYLIPIWLTHLLEYSLNVASVLSVGHIDKMALAAMSLSSMTAAVTGLALIQGFATGLDSLLATSYASSNPALVGIWTSVRRITTFLIF